MKKFLPVLLLAVSAFCFLGCESDDFEVLRNYENNSVSIRNKPQVTEIEVTKTVTEHDGILKPETISEIADGTTRVSVKTAVPKQNVYLNNIYRGKTPIVITDLIPGYYELAIETVESQDSLKHKFTTNKYLIEVKNGEAQNYYFGE